MKSLLLNLLLCCLPNWLAGQLDYGAIDLQPVTTLDYSVKEYWWITFQAQTDTTYVFGLAAADLDSVYESGRASLDAINGNLGPSATTHGFSVQAEAYIYPTDSAYVQYALYDPDLRRGVVRITYRVPSGQTQAVLLGYEQPAGGRPRLTGPVADEQQVFSAVRYLNPIGLLSLTNANRMARADAIEFFEPCVPTRIAYIPRLDCIVESLLALPVAQRQAIMNQLNKR